MTDKYFVAYCTDFKDFKTHAKIRII